MGCDNPKAPNGMPADPNAVKLTFVSSTHTAVTLTGFSVAVGPQTQAATHTLVYEICEIANPRNCDTATVTVEVTAPAIDAMNDTGGSVDGVKGGTSFTNVLVNDTLNGALVDPAAVTTSFVSSSHPGVTLVGTNVMVAPETPAGRETLVYKICEIVNPTNCDSATVTVTVAAKAPYTTYGPETWGADPLDANAGTLLLNNFTKVYSAGSVQIGGAAVLTFTSAAAVNAFLPASNVSGVLKASATNPRTSVGGVFAGAVLALRLSVDFSNAGVTPVGLANLKIMSGKLAGSSVGGLLTIANSVLGGGELPAGVSLAELNTILRAVNRNFANGAVDGGYLK